MRYLAQFAEIDLNPIFNCWELRKTLSFVIKSAVYRYKYLFVKVFYVMSLSPSGKTFGTCSHAVNDMHLRNIAALR
jgi:hypothetical protein